MRSICVYAARAYRKTMTEHSPRREHRSPAPTPFFREPGHTLGDEAIELTRWFAKSKYHLMGAFLGELMDPAPADPADLRRRFCKVVRHASRVHAVRGAVTVILALGVIAAATSSVASALDADGTFGFLERAAALSASVSVLLVALRLALDRYLERCDVSATMLAIQLRVGAQRDTQSR